MQTNLSLRVLPVLLLTLWPGTVSTAEQTPDKAQNPPRPLRIAINEDIPTLDPHHHLSATGSAVLCNIFEPLVCRDGENQPKPCLAERWQTDDSKTWTFFLRPGARFHNGKTVIEDDVLFSLQRARNDPNSEVAGFLTEIDSLKAADGVVTIVLDKPDTFFLESLSHIKIVPADAPPQITEPVGTGPYRLASYERGQIVRLQRFDQYWQGMPREKRAEFVVVPSAEDAVALLAADKIDLVSHLPPRLVETVEADPKLWVESRLSRRIIYLQLNSGTPPFDDHRVRRAIHLAIDREALMNDVMLKHARPASQMLAPSIFGYNPDLKPAKRNLARARALLKEAEVDLPLTIQATGGFLLPGQMVVSQLEEAGFRVTLETRPWPELYGDLMEGKVGAWLGFWGFDSSDASVFFNMVVHSREDTGSYGSANLTSARNPELDALIRAVSKEPDSAGREARLREVSRLTTEQHIRIPLLWPLDLYGTRRSFEWQARMDSTLPVFEMNRRR